jgi:hypothetical protein
MFLSQLESPAYLAKYFIVSVEFVIGHMVHNLTRLDQT